MSAEIFKMAELAGMGDLIERLVRVAKVRGMKKPNRHLTIIKRLFF